VRWESRSANPYPSGTFESLKWQTGWRSIDSFRPGTAAASTNDGDWPPPTIIRYYIGVTVAAVALALVSMIAVALRLFTR
jgi:hypothetical protein